MENLTPAVWVTLGVLGIGFVAWLIRLESKVNGHDKEQERLNQLNEDTWKDLENHRAAEGIHFNQRLASEVEGRQDDRFKRIETDLTEIKAIVKEIAKK